MINEYVWKTYLKADGKSIVDFFERNLENSFSKDYAHKICELHRIYCPSKMVNEDLFSELMELSDGINIDDYGFAIGCHPLFELPEGNYSLNYVMNVFYQGLKDSDNISDSQIYDEFCGGMAYYTTFLTMMFPEFFIPYYFQYNYNVFEKIAQEFGIELPPIPVKRNYKARIYHYRGICAALNDFRIQQGLTLYELCAFLYDFAPNYIGGLGSYIIEDLPDPKSVFFIGGSKDDAFLGDDPNAITCWQCSPDARAGDLIVMYLRTPVSAVDSIWRSVSVGFNDPFFYYYRCAYIAKPRKLRRITQKLLQEDPVFREIPIVRKNMQGINGMELYPSVYNHLLELADSDLPRLKYFVNNTDIEYVSEKDVENKLIKPLLEKLGYSESEYLEQLYIEIGNHNHALIPDFVIHPIVTSGHQSADFLIEAKCSIPSTIQLEEAKKQARGYAKLLNAKYSVVAAKEGIWISQAKDDYTKDILAFSWVELKHEDNFFQLSKLIGNGKV